MCFLHVLTNFLHKIDSQLRILWLLYFLLNAKFLYFGEALQKNMSEKSTLFMLFI